jgi:hypothetical protein
MIDDETAQDDFEPASDTAVESVREEDEIEQDSEQTLSKKSEDPARYGTEQFERNQEEHKPLEVIDTDQELTSLPENEEEEKEDLLRGAKKVPKLYPKKRSKTTIQQKPVKEQEEKVLSLTGISKQLDKQNNEISRIIRMLQPLQKQTKSAERQLELVKQFQLQIRQIQKQLTQVNPKTMNRGEKTKGRKKAKRS